MKPTWLLEPSTPTRLRAASAAGSMLSIGASTPTLRSMPEIASITSGASGFAAFGCASTSTRISLPPGP